jgi:hypothetical protein
MSKQTFLNLSHERQAARLELIVSLLAKRKQKGMASKELCEKTGIAYGGLMALMTMLKSRNIAVPTSKGRASVWLLFEYFPAYIENKAAALGVKSPPVPQENELVSTVLQENLKKLSQVKRALDQKTPQFNARRRERRKEKRTGAKTEKVKEEKKGFAKWAAQKPCLGWRSVDDFKMPDVLGVRSVFELGQGYLPQVAKPTEQTPSAVAKKR